MSERHLADLYLLLLCDAPYDEWHRWSNIHTVNQPNRRTSGEPRCSSPAEPSTSFRPTDDILSHNHLTRIAALISTKKQLLCHSRWSKSMITLISTRPLLSLERFIEDLPIWTSGQYMERLKGIPNLMDLVQNPFMLHMVMDTLPKIKP